MTAVSDSFSSPLSKRCFPNKKRSLSRGEGPVLLQPQGRGDGGRPQQALRGAGLPEAPNLRPRERPREVLHEAQGPRYGELSFVLGLFLVSRECFGLLCCISSAYILVLIYICNRVDADALVTWIAFEVGCHSAVRRRFFCFSADLPQVCTSTPERQGSVDVSRVFLAEGVQVFVPLALFGWGLVGGSNCPWRRRVPVHTILVSFLSCGADLELKNPCAEKS